MSTMTEKEKLLNQLENKRKSVVPKNLWADYGVFIGILLTMSFLVGRFYIGDAIREIQLIVLFIFPVGTFIFWHWTSVNRENDAFFKKIQSQVQKKTEEELVKQWLSAENTPLIKANSDGYLLPEQKGYKEMKATIYFETEKEALRKLFLPKENTDAEILKINNITKG